MQIKDAIKQLKEQEKRKFSQTFDLIINLTNIDLKKPENKVNKELILPHGRGKEIRVGLITQKDTPAAKLDELGKDKKAAKAFGKQFDFFLAEAPLMVAVGKNLGRYLAPKGKMPKPMPPGADPKRLIEDAKKSIRINVRESPTIHTIVGTEAMSDEQLFENVDFVLKNVEKILPKGRSQMKNALLKLTMSKPVKLEW